MDFATRDENVAFLRGRFLAALLEQRPRSVLDVGCGSGHVLRVCRAAGVPARGVEPDASLLAPLPAEGLGVACGSAQRLPVRDDSADWVTMRFVPHHLSDPAAALAEALRVCRSGLLVAEPWFDLALPGQENALETDRWVKRQHRRGGMVHEEPLSAADLLACLPEAHGCDVDVELSMRLRSRGLEDFHAETAPLLEELPPGEEGDAERRALTELTRAVERDGLSWNGSVLLVVRTPG